MKYMGSKRAMLQNGLGSLLHEQSQLSSRVVDLFSGSGSVSWYCAENLDLPVLSVDLQHFAMTVSSAVIERTEPLNAYWCLEEWFNTVDRLRRLSSIWIEANARQSELLDFAEYVHWSRHYSSQFGKAGIVLGCYGGHYFSVQQALTLDLLLDNLPQKESALRSCLTAVLFAASSCAAAPGHTAQPFQPTATASKFLSESWARDPLNYCRRFVRDIEGRFANVMGEARVGDAVEIASTLRSGDLVFVDPPYSSVQYIRFYHVLETISTRVHEMVNGAGRYPPRSSRPQSEFSKRTTSLDSLRQLLLSLSESGARVIITFPAGASSNGLSGERIISESSEYFSVLKQYVTGRFSTLGGNNKVRDARATASELILLLQPR